MPKRPLIVAVHGIITEGYGSAWQEDIQAHVADEVPAARALTCNYWTGPWPWLNMRVVNPIVARRLVSTIRNWPANEWEVHFIAHSNGCHVAALTMPLLVKAGYELGAAVFVAGAMPSEVGDTPVGKMIGLDRLKRAVAICSTSDMALDIGGKTAYGQFCGRVLGRKGWTIDGEPLLAKSRMATIWREGYDHSDYFMEPTRERPLLPNRFRETRAVLYEAAGLNTLLKANP